MLYEFLLSGSFGVTSLDTLVTGLVVYWLIRKWKYKFRPGPSALPLRGNALPGYRIPKGTNVAINHWGLHHNPDAWDDVDRFILERYLSEDGKLGPEQKKWLPCSVGTRVCLGEFVAKPEIHLIFASLMQRYKWKMESGLCPDITPVGNSFLLESKPYKVIAEKRI